jgi:hypothetical protein
MLSGESANTVFLVLGLIWQRFEPTIYRTQWEHANRYTIDTVMIWSMKPPSIWYISRNIRLRLKSTSVELITEPLLRLDCIGEKWRWAVPDILSECTFPEPTNPCPYSWIQIA